MVTIGINCLFLLKITCNNPESAQAVQNVGIVCLKCNEGLWREYTRKRRQGCLFSKRRGIDVEDMCRSEWVFARAIYI